MKLRVKLMLGVSLALAGAVVASTPARLDYSPVPADSLAAILSEPSDGLISGTEKRIVWHDDESPTEWSVVALHGFSASRQESAPLAELVAKNLGANLFETRFAGHGLKENGLVDVTAEQWLDDVANALTAGRLIGKKTVVVAMSHGAALALSMLDHPTMQTVDAIILLSPNFGPADPMAMWITRPGGPLLLRLVSGPTLSWEAQNERQERYWTTSYPTRTVIEVIRVVDRVTQIIQDETAPRIQVFYSPNDTVISVPALESAYATIRSPQKEINKILETGAVSAHVIAGDIMSPANTRPIAEEITRFVLRPAP
jgi:alpha-beta hydrolase superfamily lysophospholipase